MMWRTGIILAFIVGAAVLAYQIGARLSDEAITTIVGVLCGILASIPISLGLLIALTRERATYAAEQAIEPDPEPIPSPYGVYRPATPPQPQMQPPQIIVVAPPPAQLPQNISQYGNFLPAPQSNALSAPMHERNFKIVGEDDEA